MRICLAGSYVQEFPRNRRTLRMLELAGHDVTVCHVAIWRGDRVGLARKGKILTVLRAIVAFPMLFLKLLWHPAPDLYLVGYPGWFDVLTVKLAAMIRRRPVVFDMFISLFDTAVVDRGLFSPESLVGRLCLAADRWSCRMADRVILDTPSHAKYIAGLTGVPEEEFGVVHLGAQDDLFRPAEVREQQPNLVVFHGTFVPLQGLATIVQAAKILEPDGVEMRIIGDGQERDLVAELLTELRPTNVDMIGLLPVEGVVEHLKKAAVCLGIFGTTPKAQRVIPNKLFEGVAMGRAVVTGDTPAVREGFGPGELVLVKMGDAKSLANAILELTANSEKRDQVGTAGRQRYERDYREDVLAGALDRELRKVVRD